MDIVNEGPIQTFNTVEIIGDNGKSKIRVTVSSNSLSSIGHGLDSESEDFHLKMKKTRKLVNSTEKIARECAYDIINHFTNIRTNKVKPANTKYASTLRRTVDEISIKHEIFFKASMLRLEVSEENARSTIDNVANQMMGDKEFNWGRLTAVFAFCGKIAKHCMEQTELHRRAALIEKIADYTADYVADCLLAPINAHGGWDAFVDFFPAPDKVETTIWKGLLCTVVGLGALATMVVAR